MLAIVEQDDAIQEHPSDDSRSVFIDVTQLILDLQPFGFSVFQLSSDHVSALTNASAMIETAKAAEQSRLDSARTMLVDRSNG